MSIMKTVLILLILFFIQLSAVSTDNHSMQNDSSAKQSLNATGSLNSIRDFLFSFIQVLFALLTIALVLMFVYWIGKKDGILIFPFDVINTDCKYNGKAISELLKAELQRINQIISIENDEIEYEITNEDSSNHMFHPAIININVEMSGPENAEIAQIGKIDLGPSSVSIGELIVIIKQLYKNCNRGGQIINGNLETCGQNIKLVTCLTGNKSYAWTVQTLNNKKLRKDSTDEFDKEIKGISGDISTIQGLIRDLSFNIFFRLSKESIGAKTIQGFRYYIEALDNYQQYLITRNVEFLDRAGEYCCSTRIERNNKMTLGLFLKLGSAYLDKKMHDKAENMFDNVIELDSEHAEAWNMKGVAVSLQGKHKEAMEYFDKAKELYPNFANRFYTIGADLDGQGKHEDAYKAYNEANRMPQRLAAVWFNKGNALFYLREYNKSIEAYNEAIKRDPNLAVAWNNKGCSLYYLKRLNDALEAFEKAIELDRRDERAWIGKSATLGQQGMYRESLYASNMAIELNPRDAVAWDNKGQALYELGKYDEALQALDRSIELDPQLTDAWINKASVLKALGRAVESDAALAKARELGYEG